MYNFKIVLQALDLYKIHKSKKKVSKLLNISRTTIIKWISKYNNNLVNLTKVINKTHKPIEKKHLNIKSDIKDYIKQLYDCNPFYTRVQIISLIKTKFNIKISLKKLKKIVSDINYTYKKAKCIIVKNKDYIKTLQTKRIDYKNEVKKLDLNKTLFIDESGFKTLLDSNMKGHSEKGRHLNIPITEKKFLNQSLLMVLLTSGINKYEIHENKIDSNIFMNFIKSIIEPEKIKGFTFIFDNVPFHRTKATLKYITDSGNYYLFTPPYSPNNNPIENMFGIIKIEYKKQIINDIINKNLLSKTDQKIIKSKLKTKLLIESKQKIINYENYLNNEITRVNNRMNLNKDQKKKLKLNKKIIFNKFKIEEKKNIKTEFKKNDMSHIIKHYIIKTINKIKMTYTSETIIKIVNHAFNYNYDNIEKEIRDRILFLGN